MKISPGALGPWGPGPWGPGALGPGAEGAERWRVLGGKGRGKVSEGCAPMVLLKGPQGPGPRAPGPQGLFSLFFIHFFNNPRGPGAPGSKKLAPG